MQDNNSHTLSQLFSKIQILFSMAFIGSVRHSHSTNKVLLIQIQSTISFGSVPWHSHSLTVMIGMRVHVKFQQKIESSHFNIGFLSCRTLLSRNERALSIYPSSCTTRRSERTETAYVDNVIVNVVSNWTIPKLNSFNAIVSFPHYLYIICCC